jgi:hypothetical protein
LKGYLDALAMESDGDGVRNFPNGEFDKKYQDFLQVNKKNVKDFQMEIPSIEVELSFEKIASADNTRSLQDSQNTVMGFSAPQVSNTLGHSLTFYLHL